MARHCGIGLAGGRGERLGLGVPKACAEVAGRTLLERAVATLAEVCADVVVVAPAGLDPGPTPARRAFDAPRRARPPPGPLAGPGAGRGEAGAGVGGALPPPGPAPGCAPPAPLRAAA